MLHKKLISLRIFSIGDIHSYNKTHIRNIRSLMHVYRPDLILSVGDFPHDQQSLEDFRFVSYFVPGNHESLSSSSALNNIKYDGNFLCNNLKIDGFQAFKDDDLVIKKGLKVRVFGMTYSPEEEKHSRHVGHVIDPIQESIQRVVARTKQLNTKYGAPDFTIGLTHIGIANDILLTDTLLSQTSIPQDRLLTVGGHNHIINPRLNVSRNANIVHSGTNMQALGIIDVSFHADGSVNTTAENKLLSPDKTNPTILDNKEEYDDIYAPYNIDYVSLDYYHVNKLGAWFTKRIAEITHSDIVLLNGGTLREALDKRYSPRTAEITAKRIVPFDENKVITFAATATQVKAILQKEIDLLNKTAGIYDVGTLNNKLYFQVAGVKYTVVQANDGSYHLGETTFDDPTKLSYKVATIDFLWHAYNIEDIIGVNNFNITGGVARFMEEALRLDDLTVPPGIYEIKKILKTP